MTRSSWIRMGPKAHEVERRRQTVIGEEAEVGVTWPQAKEHPEPPKREEKGRLLPGSLAGAWPR